MIDFKNLDTPDKVLIGLAVFFTATVSLPLILDLSNSGNITLSLIIYIVSGLFIVISGVIFFIRQVKKQKKEIANNNLKIVSDNDYDLLIKIKNSAIPIPDLLHYINHRSSRASLLEHEIFSSGYRKCLDNIERYKHFSDNEGQNFIIYKYNWAILKITIERIKSFINQHYKIIDSDKNNLDIDSFIELIYNIVKKINGNQCSMGYEDYAVNVIGIDKCFIMEYNKIHQYTIEFLEKALSLIKVSNFSSDYNRYLSVLNTVLLYLRETFSDKHIKQVFKINGKCLDLFQKAESSIKLIGKDFEDIISIK